VSELSRSSSIVSVISLSNIVIIILITGVEEAPSIVKKMTRLAITVFVFSLIIAGNSLTQRLIYRDL